MCTCTCESMSAGTQRGQRCRIPQERGLRAARSLGLRRTLGTASSAERTVCILSTQPSLQTLSYFTTLTCMCVQLQRTHGKQRKLMEVSAHHVKSQGSNSSTEVWQVRCLNSPRITVCEHVRNVKIWRLVPMD